MRDVRRLREVRADDRAPLAEEGGLAEAHGVVLQAVPLHLQHEAAGRLLAGVDGVAAVAARPRQHGAGGPRDRFGEGGLVFGLDADVGDFDDHGRAGWRVGRHCPRAGRAGPGCDNPAMKIVKDTVVTLQYRMADLQGRLVEQSREPIAYLHGGYANTLPGIEAALEGREAGEQVTVTVEPEQAFGHRDESLVRTIPKSEFPPGVKVGGQLEGRTDDGQAQLFRVVKIKGDTVHLDGNHPLAGHPYRFTLKVLDVRAASPEEVAHRHVHGAHGHQH